MRILAIETSCDETAVAILEIQEKEASIQVRILGNALLSQIPVHALMGGVVPALAKREHSNNLIPILTLALQKADMLQPMLKPKKFDVKTQKKLRELFSHEPELAEAFIDFIPTIEKPSIDAIAVTSGPGLEPALWVGINFAKALEYIWKKPAVPVNHMEGHILAALLIKQQNDQRSTIYELKTPAFPLLSLLISGGHTELVFAQKIGSYKVIGETVDDAVGEAYDKTARMLGLPYPGGPEISKLAEDARAQKIESTFTLPRPMIGSDDLNFSFSGLKTAVLYTLQKIQKEKPSDISLGLREQIALEFENAVADVITAKVKKAIENTGAKTLVVGGGVIANKNIRKELQTLIDSEFPDVKLFLPTPDLTTDNAIMIGLAGYFKKPKTGTKKKIKAEGTLRLT
jgi:N6-L-threonylcarbamoyladenine synthase